MTDHQEPRDPGPHERRRVRPQVNRSGDPRDEAGDYVLDRNGNPLIDRYGRPVRARPRPGDQRPGDQRPLRRVRREPAAEQRPGRPIQHPPPPRRRPPRSPQQPPRPPEPRVGGAAEPPRRAPRRRRRGPGCLGCGGLVVATLLVVTLVAVLLADARLTRIDASPEPAIESTAGTNWLLVGSDSRQGLTEEQQAELGTGGEVDIGRTDTIMLLHIPFGTGESRLISLPRDSLVNIPGYGENKINAAFTFGGPKLLATTVEQNTGLNIDHYAEIGMGGLANLVDAVGGVEICVDEPITDPLANIDLQAGCQTMDGPTALGYVRTRATAQGDLDRVARQREFFAALLGEATSPATLLNPFDAIPLVYHGSGTFTVGEGDHVWHLARLALAMGTGTTTETVPIAGFQDTSVGNVVIWDETAAEEIFASMR